MEPPSDLRTTLVVDTPIAVYSGMVPGFVAGHYEAHELEIDVVPLARRAGVEVVLTAMIGIDAERQQILLDGRPPLGYDLASIDIGSTVVGLGLPGVAEHAIPTRPIGRLVERVDEFVRKARQHGGRYRVVVVGGGAGGVELAFTLERRLRVEGVEPEVTLVNAGVQLLEGFPSGLGRRARTHAARRDIEVRCESRVAGVTDERVMLESGDSLGYDALIWVAGATSHGILEASGLPTDRRGFVRIRSTLQVEGFDTLFAVGDCATLTEAPGTPKAGVYAVRQGPYLADNLRAAAAGDRLRPYQPQGDFLTLLNLGDGSALGAKWGSSFEGRWVMGLKDRIDRKFMDRFQVLDSSGAELNDFAAMPPMAGASSMTCGGCAAKLGQDPLARVLNRLELPADRPPIVFGAEASEDVVAYQLSGGDTVVASVDAFRPFSDDPFLVGRVAAVNAASDLLAKGVRPTYAQAVVAVPDALADSAREEYLFQTLSGAMAAFAELGVTLLGGHTTTAPAPLVGFHVEGTAPPEGLLAKAGAQPGDLLVVTKPLGTGVVLYSDMRGRARGPWLKAAQQMMIVSNAAAAQAARALGASAATDITGFGLAGHLGDLLLASGVGARLELDKVPALPGALELLERGERSTFHPENRKALDQLRVDDELSDSPRLELLFDPQTSGGLLLAVPAGVADALVERVKEAIGLEAAVVGEVTAAAGEKALVVTG